jgi:hypothetical protein
VGCSSSMAEKKSSIFLVGSPFSSIEERLEAGAFEELAADSVAAGEVSSGQERQLYIVRTLELGTGE